jgi:hypothetical protein
MYPCGSPAQEKMRYPKSTLLVRKTTLFYSRIGKTSLYLVFAATGMV